MFLLIHLSTTRVSTRVQQKYVWRVHLLRPERVNSKKNNKTILQIKQKSDQAKDKSYFKPKTFSLRSWKFGISGFTNVKRLYLQERSKISMGQQVDRSFHKTKDTQWVKQ